MTFKLHNFFRSSTSTRLRAALNLKGLSYDYVSYALRKGETRTPAFLKMNPAGLVPALERDDGQVMVQSLAIIELLLQELTALWTGGPAGGGGVRVAKRQRLSNLACLIPRDKIPATVHFV